MKSCTSYKFFKVRLASPPEDTWSVTFYLHESYSNPVRETQGPDFSFATATDGDHIIQAKIFRKKRVDIISVNLSDAFRATCAGSTNPSVLEAIDVIANN